MFIKVRAKKVVTNEDLVFLNIEPKDANESYWADAAIRTEDIADFYELSPKRLVVTFYDERPRMIIADTLESLLQLTNNYDYCEVQEEE